MAYDDPNITPRDADIEAHREKMHQELLAVERTASN